MPPFSWTPALAVDIAFMDDDHRKMIAMVDDFYEAFAQGRNPEKIGTLLDQLINFTEQHFEREENEMLRLGYPGYKAHAYEHRKLLDQLTQLKMNYKGGEIFLPATISRFLRDWLIRHIAKTDHILADAIRDAQAP